MAIRDTNPLLSKTPGIIAFPDATTQSNTTHKSVPMLLSAASAEDFERHFHEKGILAAFREAGFHTVFISNQLPNHSFIDFLGEQADEHYFLKEGASAKDNHYELGIYAQDANHQDDADHCSPLCTCSCCSSVIEVTMCIYQIKNYSVCHDIQFSFYQQAVSSFNSSIWQPPKIS